MIKRKYQFDQGNVPESEQPIYVNLEVSPEMSLSELKEIVKNKLHPKYNNQVELKGQNFSLLCEDAQSLAENGLYDNCILISS